MTEIIPTCPYCDGKSVFVDSIEVYSRSHGYIYLCRPCHAWVGVHEVGYSEGMPLGTLANKETRLWRQKAHALFDPLWQMKITKDNVSKKKARKAGYQWLANLLDIDVKECHIANFQSDICQRVVVACEPYYKKEVT